MSIAESNSRGDQALGGRSELQQLVPHSYASVPPRSNRIYKYSNCRRRICDRVREVWVSGTTDHFHSPFGANILRVSSGSFPFVRRPQTNLDRACLPISKTFSFGAVFKILKLIYVFPSARELPRELHLFTAVSNRCLTLHWLPRQFVMMPYRLAIFSVGGPVCVITFLTNSVRLEWASVRVRLPCNYERNNTRSFITRVLYCPMPCGGRAQHCPKLLGFKGGE